MGGVDLQRDLNTSGGNLQTLYARSHLVLASRAAGIEPPIDSVYPQLDDADGSARAGRVRPVPGVLRQVGDPPPATRDPAPGVHPHRRGNRLGTRGCRRASTRPAAEASRLPSGEFVDLPVADRARRLLEIAGVRETAAAGG